jgi:hypothetical protein
MDPVDLVFTNARIAPENSGGKPGKPKRVLKGRWEPPLFILVRDLA